MEAAIKRSKAPNATIQSIITPIDPSVEDLSSITLTNPQNASLYFSTLFEFNNRNPNPVNVIANVQNPFAIVGLLYLPTPMIKANPNASLITKNNDMIDLMEIMDNSDILVETAHHEKRTSNNCEHELTVDQAILYMKAVASNIHSMIYILKQYGNDFHMYIKSISETVMYASSLCQNCRSEITATGILPALAKLAQMETSSQSQQPSGELTIFHRDFLLCSMFASQYRFALEFILSNPIYSIMTFTKPSSSSSSILSSSLHNHEPHFGSDQSSILSSQEYLSYFYYEGLIYLRCHYYTKALKSFYICLTTPISVKSPIMVRAYLKMILIKCLMMAYQDENEDDDDRKQNFDNNSKQHFIDENYDDDDGSIQSKPLGHSNNDTTYTDDIQATKKLLSYPHSTSLCMKSYLDNAMKSFLSKSNYTSGVPRPSSSSSSTAISPADDDFYYFENYYSIIHYGFMKLNVSEFDHQLNKLKNSLIQDGNFGLVKQLRGIMQYRILRNISKIYESISMKKLGSLMGLHSDNPNDVQNVLMTIALQQKELQRQKLESDGMVFTNSLNFSMDVKNSLVFFTHPDDDDDDGSCNTTNNADRRLLYQKRLMERITLCMDLAERVRTLDVNLAKSSKYQQACIEKDRVKVPRGVSDPI